MKEHEALVELQWRGKSTRRKAVPVSLRPTQKRHALTWDWIRLKPGECSYYTMSADGLMDLVLQIIFRWTAFICTT